MAKEIYGIELNNGALHIVMIVPITAVIRY